MSNQLSVKTTNPIIIAMTLFIIAISITSCYYDKEEILFPQSVCDTIAITFNRSVVPILSSNCYSCHAGNTPSAGIALDTYAGVKLQADNGKLVGAISHAAGYSPMPKNTNQLSACIISQIKKWVTAGAPNN